MNFNHSIETVSVTYRVTHKDWEFDDDLKLLNYDDPKRFEIFGNRKM